MTEALLLCTHCDEYCHPANLYDMGKYLYEKLVCIVCLENTGEVIYCSHCDELTFKDDQYDKKVCKTCAKELEMEEEE